MGARQVIRAAVAAGLGLAAVAAGAQQTSSEAVSLLRDAVLTLKGAYIMLPPKAVLRDVDEVHWSPDGSKLIAVSHSQKAEVDAALQNLALTVEVPKEHYLALVDPKTLNYHWIGGIKHPFDSVSIEWPAEGSFCVVTGLTPPDEKKTSIYQSYIVDLTLGSARPLPGDISSNRFFLAPFGRGKTMLFGYQTAQQVQPAIFILDAQGNIAPPPPGLDNASEAGWIVSYWSDRLGIVLAHRDGRFAVLLPSGTVQPLDRQVLIDDRKLEQAKASSEPPLLVSQKRAKQGSEAWLVASTDVGIQPSALICGLTEQAALSPNLRCVAYTSQRMLWIRPVQHLDAEETVLIREQLHRAEMIEKGKKIGVALMMYMTDHDDFFPKGDPVTALKPYAKDDTLFPGFVFTFSPGQSWIDIENVTRSEIGYFRLRGGRVVVYADTVTKWVPDK